MLIDSFARTRQHRPLASAFMIGLLALALTACNSTTENEPDNSDGESSDNEQTETPVQAWSAPEVTLSYDDWLLTLTWPDIADATYYEVQEDPDGLSGFSTLATNLTDPEFTYNINLSERSGSRYIVTACNDSECLDSDEVSIDTLDIGIDVIAASGMAVPDNPGASYADYNLFRFDVNQAGNIAFVGTTDQTDTAGSSQDGVFYYEVGNAVTPMQMDDTTISGGASINGFIYVYLADSGEALYTALLNTSATPSVNGNNNEVLLKNTNGTPSVIAREGHPSDGGTSFPTLEAQDVYFQENIQGNRVFRNMQIDGQGGVTFQLGSNTDAFRVSNDSAYGGALSALWSVLSDNSREQTLRSGESALPGNLEPSVFSTLDYSKNTQGQLAFGLALSNTDNSPVPSSTNSGVYVRNTDGTFTERVREAGGSARDYIDRLQNSTPQITDNGEVFYLAQRDVAIGGSHGLYTDSVNGGFTRIARADTPFLLQDGSTQDITGFIGGNTSFAATDESVTFLIHAGSLDQEDALIQWTSGVAEKRFQEGDPIRGLPDSSDVDLHLISIGAYPRLAVNASGWAAYKAEIDGGLNQTILLASSPSGYTRLLAREGQTLFIDGEDYGTVMAINDFAVDPTNHLIVTLRLMDEGVQTHGLFRMQLCADNESC